MYCLWAFTADDRVTCRKLFVAFLYYIPILNLQYFHWEASFACFHFFSITQQNSCYQSSIVLSLSLLCFEMIYIFAPAPHFFPSLAHSVFAFVFVFCFPFRFGSGFFNPTTVFVSVLRSSHRVKFPQLTANLLHTLKK